jgi:hypothetical protein
VSSPPDAAPPSSPETIWGVWLGVVVNLACIAVLNNPAEARPVVWLATLAIANELLGIVLIASPELWPRTVRVYRSLSGVLSRAVSPVVRRVRRILRFPPPGQIVSVGGIASSVSLSGHATATTAPSPGATESQLIDYLIRQERRSQERLDELERRLGVLPAEWREEIERARAEMERLSRELVREVADRRIRLRLLGLLYVAIGIVLSGLANVV